MRRCLLVFLSVLALLVTGCKKGESNFTQSTASPTASASPTPVATNRTAKLIVLLYHRFEDRPAELVTTPNDFRAQMKALKDNGVSVISMINSRTERQRSEFYVPPVNFDFMR